jgi:hypothetical protein
LTKTVKPKLETSTFWCLCGFFPNSLKKEAHCCFDQKGGSGTLSLNYLGMGKERLRVGEKESFQAQHVRDYWLSLLSRLILPEGSTRVLEARGDLYSQATETMKEA